MNIAKVLSRNIAARLVCFRCKGILALGFYLAMTFIVASCSHIETKHSIYLVENGLSENCRLPCWHDIRPQETSLLSANSILLENNLIVPESKIEFVTESNQFNSQHEITQINYSLKDRGGGVNLLVINDIVYQLSLFSPAEELSYLISNIGSPQFVYIGNRDSEVPVVDVSLHWTHQGVIAYFLVEAGTVDKVTISGKQKMGSLAFYQTSDALDRGLIENANIPEEISQNIAEKVIVWNGLGEYSTK